MSTIALIALGIGLGVILTLVVLYLEFCTTRNYF